MNDKLTARISFRTGCSAQSRTWTPQGFLELCPEPRRNLVCFSPREDSDLLQLYGIYQDSLDLHLPDKGQHSHLKLVYLSLRKCGKLCRLFDIRNPALLNVITNI